MTERVANKLLRKVASYEECDVTDLPALQDAIDMDALAALVESSDEVEVRFSYTGYEVNVSGDGSVDVVKL